MTLEERKQYIYKAMLEMIQADSDLVVEICDELDSWNGFLGDDRCYNMCDIDDLLYGKKPSEIIDMITKDFDSSCEWFYFSIYGLESCDDKADFYLDTYSHEDILDNYIENYSHCSLSNTDLEELAEIYDSYDEDDMEDEDDEEFKSRIDELVS
jgi:hypothetical protein